MAPLVGFNSQPEWLLDRVTLPIVAGMRTFHIEFLVVNTPPHYNGIHQMETVPSAYH